MGCGASADKAAYKIDAAPAAEATTPDEVARIDQEQQKNVASGEAARGRTSIKLDPEYAESLRLKVARFCQAVGGFEVMFNMADVDKSKTVDVHEFRKLLAKVPTGSFALAPEVKPELNLDGMLEIKDVYGKQQLVKPTEKLNTKEHLKISKREATALFWHLDTDESDLLEPDEFEAWLKTGGHVRTAQRQEITSYRKPKPQ